MTGVNHRDMNTKNKYVILKALATQGAMPRNELSMLSGLSKMAVTAIANEYMLLNHGQILWNITLIIQ